jgi:hypothetical protein
VSYWFRQRVMKFNPHHDDRGRFASTDGGREAAASSLFNRATKDEPSVSQAIAKAVPGYAKLDGFANRLKSQASTSRKIGKKMAEEGLSLTDATSAIKDSLRYTVILPEDKYVEGIKHTLDGMKAEGFAIPSFRNTWGTPIYQGVNVNLKTPEGNMLEVQFHTPDSLSTKGLNHVDYEVNRQVGVSEADKEKTNTIMKDRQSKLKVPQGALGYNYG